MRKIMACAVVVLAATGIASAAVLEVVSGSILDAADQEVLIVARGTEMVGGVNLNVQIGDGGSLAGGSDVPGTTVAGMQTIDFRRNSAIWGVSDALVEEPGIASPLLSFGGFGLAAGFKQLPDVATGGAVIATLILDATGLPLDTTFQISLEPLSTPSDMGGVPTQLIAGEIVVVPEPASALLLLLGAVPFLRRRRA